MGLSEQEFKNYFDSELSDYARGLEKEKDAIAPHYKRFYKRALLLLLPLLVAEIIFRDHLYGDSKVLFMPIVIGVVFIFGSIIKGIASASKAKNFDPKFNELITTKLASILFKGWGFEANETEISDRLKHHVQFDNIPAPSVLAKSIFNKDDKLIFTAHVHYRTTNPNKSESVMHTSNAGQHMDIDHDIYGVYFIKPFPGFSKDEWLLLPDYVEGRLGGFTELAEGIADMYKVYLRNISSMSERRQKEGDPTYDKEIIRFNEDKDFELRYRVYKTKKSPKPSFLNAENRAKILALTEKTGNPLTISMRGGELCIYAPLKRCFAFSEDDIFRDISQYNYYKKFYHDAELLHEIINAFDDASMMEESLFS